MYIQSNSVLKDCCIHSSLVIHYLLGLFQFELAKMRVTLNELKDSMDKAIADQEFILAQSLKLEADRVTAEQIKLHDEIQQEKALTIVEDVRTKNVIF